jgi:DNA-directed RNA polymerase subunit RPC12/RpoP
MSVTNCLKCNHDCSELVNIDTLVNDYIQCPNCGNKMTIAYEEWFDDETCEEDYLLSLKQFEENTNNK